MFEILRERPVGHVQHNTNSVHHSIQFQKKGVSAVSNIGQPADMLDHTVEQVAMDNPQSLAVGSFVDVVFLDGNLAKIEAEIVARGFVMIAWDIDNVGTAAGFAQQFLDDVIMFLRPEKAFLQLPAINDIANKIEFLATCVFQEMKQCLGTTTLSAKMSV